MDKKKQKKLAHLTPEEVIARAARAKARFKAIVRFVIKNAYWMGDIEDEELGEDVQKNILLLTRRKERKSLLGLADKYILTKPTESRTDAEKILLDHIIGGLKCFRRYPAHVKSQLAGVTYFQYFPPGRVIVKQGHESRGLYFIIAGEVTVSQETYDGLLEEYVTQDIAIMGPGSMFGEVGLLHDIPRTATITSKTDIELLFLKKNDFDNILKATVKQQWDEIQLALSKFTYFEDWDEIAIRECCIMCKMQAYQTDQTILGDGIGLSDYTYFIIKGKCRVIEHLLVTSKIVNGKKVYKLYEPPPETVETKPKHKKDDEKLVRRSKSSLIRIGSSIAKLGRVDTGILVDTIKEEDTQPAISQKQSDTLSVRPFLINPDTKPTRKLSNVNLPKNVETHFMQVYFLDTSACFNIGENLKHRRVVAVSQTQCLLIPRYWLLTKNKANIWSRVKQFLDRHIPDTKEVFQEFDVRRKWLKHRRDLAERLTYKRVANDNTNSNIPYFTRIGEELCD